MRAPEQTRPIWTQWLGPAVLLALLVAWVVVFVDVGRHLGAFKRWHYQGVVFSVVGLIVAAIGWQGQVRGRGRVLLAGLLAFMIGATLWVQSGHVRNIGNRHQVQLWGAFHYYMGAKYFEELGYHDLYTQVLVADRETTKKLLDVKLVRNLETYEKEKASEYRERDRLPVWSDARWDAFTTDLAWFLERKKPLFWANIIVDRGYNPSPAWHAVGGTWIRLLDIKVPWQQTLLILLDPLLLLGAFALSVKAWGWTRSLLLLFAFVSWFGNAGRVVGQIWIYDWFAAAWAGVSAWRLGWPMRAGLLIGYATMVRVFPGLLLLGPMILGIWGLARHRTVDHGYLRLGLGALAAAALLFVAGSASTTRGVAGWGDFLGNVAHHSEQHAYGSKRLGLRHAMGIDFAGGLRVKPDKRSNRLAVRANKPAERALQLTALLLFGLALARSSRADALLIGLPLMFFLTVASRYYGSIWVLLLLLGIARGSGEEDARPVLRQLADLTLFGVGILFFAMSDKGPEGIHQYMYTNVILAGWMLFVLGQSGVFGWGDPESAAADEQADGAQGREPDVAHFAREDDVAEPVVEHGDHGRGAADDARQGRQAERHGDEGLQIPPHREAHAQRVEHAEHEGQGSHGHESDGSLEDHGQPEESEQHAVHDGEGER